MMVLPEFNGFFMHGGHGGIVKNNTKAKDIKCIILKNALESRNEDYTRILSGVVAPGYQTWTERAVEWAYPDKRLLGYPQGRTLWG
jgi:hypothetical protein